MSWCSLKESKKDADVVSALYFVASDGISGQGSIRQERWHIVRAELCVGTPWKTAIDV